MLFNDFLLLTRIKRPLITKILQLMNRTTRQQQNQYIVKKFMPKTNLDWFDSSEADHLYLIVFKKVSLIVNEKKKSFCLF